MNSLAPKLPSFFAPIQPWPPALAKRYRAEGYWLDVTLPHWFSQCCANHCDAYALIDEQGAMTYGEALLKVQLLAAKLRLLGIQPGEIVVLQQGNHRGLPLGLMACLWAGLVPLLALPGQGSLEMNSWIGQTGARVYWGDGLAPAISLPADGLLLGNEHCPLLNLTAAPMQEPEPQDPDALALLLVSGGSTGTPKLIPRSHNDYLCCVRLSSERCAIQSAHRYLCLLPAGHNFALSSPGILGFWHAGACVVLSQALMPTDQLAQIQHYGITHSALVPAQVLRWLASVARAPQLKAKVHGLKLQIGGAPLDAFTAQAIEEQLGVQLQQVFGMAEGLLHYTDPDDSLELRTSTQGRPLCAADEIRLLGLDGCEVAPGEAGELCTQGPYTLRAYYPNRHNPAADLRARSSFTADGWYRSGDWVRQLPSGHIQVLGRLKDQINRGGEKIDCSEVEGLLRSHPAVLDAALVGLADPYLGEVACACISLKEPLSPLTSLVDYLVSLGLAHYKIPARWLSFERLPLTAVGKVDKNALRRELPPTLTASTTAYI
ncbi:MAG TPA: AMP-binding protein [Cellvibrionaceae bacterium]